MASAKERMLKLLKENVGKIVKGDDLAKVAGIHDWARSIRTLRQEGWKIEYFSKEKGYVLCSLKKGPGRYRVNIDLKTRVLILKRDGYRCRYCGRGSKDGVKLVVDHVIPVDIKDEDTPDEYQTLCYECNQGKKNLFRDEDPELMKMVFKQTSDKKRLAVYLDAHLGGRIPVSKLLSVVKGREWVRALRYLREEGYKVKYVKGIKGEEDCYIVTR